jgi:hypothetical protein
MGELQWAAYEPPTAEQLEKQQRIRDRIERLSVRPLRDTVSLDRDKYVKVGDWTGVVAVVLLAAALGVTLIWGWL